MTKMRILFTLALLTATLALPTVATAQCTPFGLGLFYMDLDIPTTVNVSFFPPPANPGPHVEMLGEFTNSGCNEALLKVTIPTGCTEAHIWAQYKGMPTGWTINVGDSPGNDGFGGDTNEPDSEAELQILDETLSVYSKALGSGIVDLLAKDDLGLTDGALQIVVRDQYVSWGQPFSALDTTNSGLLFALPDAGAAPAEQNTFYLGVNRVVSDTPGRTGCGVHRVLVSFH